MTRNCYRDGRDKCVVAVLKKKPHTVVISKRFQCAVFTIQEEWTVAGQVQIENIIEPFECDVKNKIIKIFTIFKLGDDYEGYAKNF